MSIWSNQSSVQKPFTSGNAQMIVQSPNYGNVPDWKRTKGYIPGTHPVVAPLGVTAKLESTLKDALGNFPNILKITS